MVYMKKGQLSQPISWRWFKCHHDGTITVYSSRGCRAIPPQIYQEPSTPISRLKCQQLVYDQCFDQQIKRMKIDRAGWIKMSLSPASEWYTYMISMRIRLKGMKLVVRYIGDPHALRTGWRISDFFDAFLWYWFVSSSRIRAMTAIVFYKPPTNYWYHHFAHDSLLDKKPKLNLRCTYPGTYI